MAIVYDKISKFPFIAEVYHQFFKLLDQNNFVLRFKMYSCGVDYQTKKPKRVLGFKYSKYDHYPLWNQAFTDVSNRHGIVCNFDDDISHRPYMITVQFLKAVNDLKSMGHLTDCKCLIGFDKAYNDYMLSSNQQMIAKPIIQQTVNQPSNNNFPTKSDYQIVLNVANFLSHYKGIEFQQEVLDYLENQVNPKITKRVIYICRPNAEVPANEYITAQKAKDDELIEYVALTLHPAYISLLNDIDKSRFVLNKLALHNVDVSKHVDTTIAVFGDVAFVYGKSKTLDFMTQIALVLKGKISIEFV